jgi:hypothetical protein
MFVITMDPKFTVASSVTCTAYAATTEIVYYNNTAGGHALDCKESAQTTTSLTDADP